MGPRIYAVILSSSKPVLAADYVLIADWHSSDIEQYNFEVLAE